MLTAEKTENKSSQPRGKVQTNKYQMPILDLNQLNSQNQVYDYSNHENEVQLN